MRPSPLLTLLLLSLSLPSWAAETLRPTWELRETLRGQRLRSAYISAGLGAGILVLPYAGSSASKTEKLLFSLAGATVLLSGIKNLTAESQSERIFLQIENLRQSGQLSAEAEGAMLAEMADWARSERLWNASLILAGGAVSLVSAANVNDRSLKKMALFLGGLSIVGGTMSLLKPSSIEKFHEQYAGWELSPALFFAGSPVPGFEGSVRF